MIIKLSFHSLVIYTTLAMGLGYALAHMKRPFGFWKLALVGALVIPVLYWTAYINHHPIEVVVGLVIGWLYERDKLDLPRFSLPSFNFISRFFDNRARKRADDKARAEFWKRKVDEASAKVKADEEEQDEARRRQEQAKQRRQAKDQGQKRTKSNEQKQQSQDRPKTRQQVDIRTSYVILGITKEASKPEIKRAYRLLVSRYHPDRCGHMSEVFRLEAEEEFKKVKEAYERLK